MVVYVNLDPSEGLMHTPASTKDVIQNTLNNRMSHYAPQVSVAPDGVLPDSVKTRAALIVTVDLDPTPGTMHTQESAHNVVRNIIAQRVPQYEPLVSIAPSYLRPSYN